METRMTALRERRNEDREIQGTWEKSGGCRYGIGSLKQDRRGPNKQITTGNRTGYGTWGFKQRDIPQKS